MDTIRLFLVAVVVLLQVDLSASQTDGGWSTWAAWDCPVTCGGGEGVRDRACDNPVPAGGGLDCPGPANQTDTCNDAPCPVDGMWSTWNSWACDVTCGGGTLSRGRTCDNPTPVNGGAACPGLPSEVASVCATNPCPVDGVWSTWTSWACDVTCGDGTSSRTRACDDPEPAHGGVGCSGAANETAACPVASPCPIDGMWSTWGTWSCDVTCGGGGTLSRSRACNNPAPENGGAGCPGLPTEVASVCGQTPCPVDGVWSSWTALTCTATCGGGVWFRDRACDNPAPQHGGTNCPGSADQTGSDCNEQPCPVDGLWSSWTTLTCTATCGGGVWFRDRACDNPAPQHGGSDCAGSADQTGSACNEDPCPVDGVWSSWSALTCTATCGGGVVFRDRTCDNPAPQHGGSDCPGSSEQTGSACNEDPCPVNGAWSSWTALTCTATCGGGVVYRDRTCDNPEPQHGGVECTGSAEQTGSPCNEEPCPVDGMWSIWSTWTCDVTCGGGTSSRERTCDNPAPANGGADCSGSSNEVGEACNDNLCPVDGMWSTWTTWSCSVTCGVGDLSRQRTCDNPAPANGGADCAGAGEEVSVCSEDPCPVDGMWSTWRTWTCDVTCGLGTLSRERTCTQPENGGADCIGSSEEIVSSCNPQPCPIDGMWTTWTTWSCSVTCGVGDMSRSRTCSNPEPQHRGAECSGSPEEISACSEQPCPVDGAWSTWTSWSCSITCGIGDLARSRTCDNPAPQHGGDECPGLAEEMSACSGEPCIVDGGWSAWSQWWCSKECGGGVLTRARVCDNPEPLNGGLSCGEQFLEQGDACNEDPCKNEVNGAWSSWSVWGSCDVTCGGGSRRRTRACDDPAPANGGQDCDGDLVEQSEDCNDFSCSASLGSSCDPAMEESACLDPHAVCVHLTRVEDSFCTCPMGFVRVRGQTDECHLVLNAADNGDCETCIQNQGQCFANATNENIMGGCLCPTTRATVDQPCDTELELSADCNAEEMTVCYNETRSVGIFDLLEESTAIIYTVGHRWDPACHFSNESEDAYCLRLGLESSDCGLVTRNRLNELSFMVRVRLQKSEQPSHGDMKFLASCTFNKVQQVSSTQVDIISEEDGREAEEGLSAVADIALRLTDPNDNDLSEVGFVMGAPLKMSFIMTDDAGGLFSSLRVEVCLLSDSNDIDSASAIVYEFLFDGCPTDSFRDDVEILHISGEKSQAILLRATPMFEDSETGFLFVHCAVKTCIQPAECAPRTCSGIRKRRDAAMARFWLHQPELRHLAAALKLHNTAHTSQLRSDVRTTDASSALPIWPLLVPVILTAVIFAIAAAVLYGRRRSPVQN